MGLQFHETEYGKRFFDVQLPSLIKAVERLADANGKQQAAEPAVDTTANMVYVCYEENSNELAIENGAINEMCVAFSLNDVYQWIRKRRKEAEQNSYTVLNDMEASEFYKELMASRECALHLYHNGDEDSRLYYALTVKPFIASNGLSQKASGETYGRLRAVMASTEKSEKLGEVFCEQIETDDENCQRIGYYLAKAILEDNIEDLLVAVCGWTSKSVLNIADYGMAYPEVENK